MQYFVIDEFKTLDFTDASLLIDITFGSSVCESVDLSGANYVSSINYTGSKLKSLDVSCCQNLTSFYSVDSGLPKLIVGVGQQIEQLKVDDSTIIVQKGSSSTEPFTRN